MEAAISPVWHLHERDRLAATVAKRLWLAHGGQPQAEPRDEGSLLMLEAMVSRHLTHEVVRTSLGLRYLEALAANVCRADYEDVAGLLQEAHWVEAYLSRRVYRSLPAHFRMCTRRDEDVDDFVSLESLYEALVRVSAAELRSAGAAA